MLALSSRVTGITLSSVALLLTVGSYLGQPKSPASSQLEIGFSALEEVPAQSPDRSIQAFRSALELDPASPFRWCDLGEAYLLGGDVEKAKVCYLRGSVLGPRMPAVQLRLCNFQIRTGDFSNAGACLAGLLKTAPAYREMVFSYYDRLGFSPEQFAGQMGAATLSQSTPHATLLGNGDFEGPIGEGAFNWTIEGSGIERDCGDAFSGKCSLKIQSSAGAVSQTILLRPGVYKLELFTRSEEASSVRASLTDVEDAARFIFHSDPLEAGSTWKAVACTFTIPPRTRFVTVRLESAAVQLDHISITPAGSKAP